MSACASERKDKLRKLNLNCSRFLAAVSTPAEEVDTQKFSWIREKKKTALACDM